MNAKKKGLGKGLSALFGDEKVNKINNNNNVFKVSISELIRNNYQPRINFDEEKLIELSNSIKKSSCLLRAF